MWPKTYGHPCRYDTNKDQTLFDDWTLLDLTAHFGYFDVCELLIKDADKCIGKSPKTDGRIPRVLHEVTKNSLNKILDLVFQI